MPACGCIVVTDLPSDEIVPEIDDNLVRVHPSIDMGDLRRLIDRLAAEWDAERQRDMAESAKARFDYRVEGLRLSKTIDDLRGSYSI